VLERDGNHGIAHEWRSPDQHFVEHDAKTVEVGAAVDGEVLRLLRRQVLGGAGNGSCLREVGVSCCVRNAEVDHLDVPIRFDQDVVRLDVAVHQPLPMRRLQCRGHLRRDVERLVFRQGSPTPHHLA
jgi:hypothetical protein